MSGVLPAKPADLAMYAKQILPFSLSVTNPVIELPNKFESMLLWSLVQLKQGYWNGKNGKGTIASRRLLVGVHNGTTFTSPPLDIPLRPMYEVKRGDEIEITSAAPLGEVDAQVVRLEGRIECALSQLQLEVVGNDSVVIWFELVYDIDWANTGNTYRLDLVDILYYIASLLDMRIFSDYHNLEHALFHTLLYFT